MNAEIIAVGTEILTGQIVNTNAQFISEKMAEIGVDVYYQTAIGDNEKRLLDVIEMASRRSDLIILTGGLGPTEDDLTKQTLARFLGKTLVFDQQAKDKLDQFFASRPKSSRTSNNERQAQIIEGSIPIQNITGLAVGGLLVDGEKTYVVLPGPPSELKPMVTKHLVPLLSKGNEILYSKVLRFFGIGESQLVTVLSEYIKNQTDPTIAPYAKTGEVTLRLSTKSNSEQEANEKLDALEKELLSVRSLDKTPLSEYLYGYGEDNSLAKVVFENILNRKLTISAAESLTAGMFQAKIADFSGSSQLFKGGYVTYSIEEKARMLGIPLVDLQKHGVVSHFTAQQMALKSRQLMQSDIGVGLTGVAGPGELEGHPAGTVYIGISTTEKTESIQVSIGGRSRSDIRYIAMMHAFNLVRKTLL
ncbi:competence/damage-inducible protein A [Streptococcus bovimastitidis]|uniref:Putative competence-damage inducible protein n=1 Tax=Streptococcus bovimastitidis TaxID=1856638 RepID=A0A1L8MM73_9STRE|nr:competence/damage-inducible protein A [Streptococcus bovimastitidis]OJF71870.1 competence/damage-inducible protein A [Streptococcus bovimastitidis]